MSQRVPPSRGRRRTASAGSDASPSFVESAQQIWLAGMGALGRAQQEGTRLFETLAREGAELERKARTAAGAGIHQVRENVDAQVDQARETAAGVWDRLEAAIEPRVSAAIRRIGVPSRAEIDALRAEIESLRAELHARARSAPAVKKPRVAPAAPAAKKTVRSRRKPAV
ncbi:phasin family protein [Coralloluteibacterium thermophilus]|uniref:Phasin family protein n=1 Tax=Coralloluteibacterium thermophilum TaxID=2707049 RepID=A0ABV9NPC0_9GAMM